MGDNFLWRRISDEEKEDLKREAKRIMESFGKALEKVEKEVKETGLVEREEKTRKETKTELDPEFSKIFLKNAPQTEKDENGEWVKAEKGAWK